MKILSELKRIIQICRMIILKVEVGWGRLDIRTRLVQCLGASESLLEETR